MLTTVTSNSTPSVWLQIVVILLAGVFIFTYVIFISYLNRLSTINCECAYNWRRTFITYGYAYAIFSTILLTFHSIGLQMPYFILLPLIIIAYTLSIPTIILTFQYIRMLKKEACSCSESKARTLMEVVNYLVIFITISSIVMVLVNTILFLGRT